jgi:hypothetical protein
MVVVEQLVNLAAPWIGGSWPQLFQAPEGAHTGGER